MPELPEVRFVAQTFNNLILGKKITEIKVFYPKIMHNDPDFVPALLGQHFDVIKTHGKYLAFQMPHDVLIVHLRMEGRFLYSPVKLDEYTKHDHIVFVFDDGSELVYRDTRKFGRFELMGKDYLTKDPFTRLAKEPFEMPLTELVTKLAGKKQAIKDSLLDQSIIAGIGNIYASEILFEAGIHPTKPAGLLSEKEIEKILIHSIAILTEATLQGGTTVDSFESMVGVAGNYQHQLKVYGRKNLPCYKCGTPIVKFSLSNRGTYYCPNCQPRMVIGLTGLVASGKSTVTAILDKHGFGIISADEIVKTLYEIEAVFETVNELVGLPKDNCDKSLIASILAQKPRVKQLVNDYIHPMVLKIVDEQIKDNKHYFVVVEMPLLFDVEYDQKVDLVVLVEAAKGLRLARLMEKGFSEEHAKTMLNLQKGIKMSEEDADIIIDNNGLESDLINQVMVIIDWIEGS